MWAITSFCSFSIKTSRNSIFLLSVAVRMCPADSAPAASASSSVAIASHCFPAAIRSLARSFSCYGERFPLILGHLIF